MAITFKQIHFAWLCALAIGLAACGGGGGGGAADTSSSPLPVATNASGTQGAAGFVPNLPLQINDSGGVDGGAGAGGDSGADGTAGDGERVRIVINFAALKGTWTVVTSAYGITGQSAIFNLVADPKKGGYRYVGAKTAQDNLYISRSGIVTGSLPLIIAGTERKSKVVAVLDTQLESSLVGIAGTYNVGYTVVDPAGTFSFKVVVGSMRVSSAGVLRICPFAAYSDTCAAVDGVAPSTGALAVSASETGRFQVTLDGRAEGVASAINHADGRALAWDYIIKNSAGVVTTTGSRVASLQTTPAPNTSIYTGAWAITGQSSNFNSSFGSSTSTYAGSVNDGTLSWTASSKGTGLQTLSDQTLASGGFINCVNNEELPIAALPGSFGSMRVINSALNYTATNVVSGLTILQAFTKDADSTVILPLSQDSVAYFYIGGASEGKTYYNGVLQTGFGTKDAAFYGYGFGRRLSKTPVKPGVCP